MEDYSSRPTLYIDPPSKQFLRDRLFNEEKDNFVGSNILAPYIYMFKQLNVAGIDVHTADYIPEEPTPDKKIYISFGLMDKYKKLAGRNDITLSAFFAMECPIVDPFMYRKLKQARKYFKRIYSWSDPHSMEKFTGASFPYTRFNWPQSFDDVHVSLWGNSNRQFLVMINSNKMPYLFQDELYTERLKAIDYFYCHSRIDLYGVGWDQDPLWLAPISMPYTFRRIRQHYKTLVSKYIHPVPYIESSRKAYKGRIESKADLLSKYKFCLCFENTKLNGWITEKIFDCFFSGCIPVYLGAPDICDHVPSNCFIDMRDFAGYEALNSYISSLNEGDCKSYRENARKFLGSEKFYPFSKRFFYERIFSVIKEDL